VIKTKVTDMQAFVGDIIRLRVAQMTRYMLCVFFENTQQLQKSRLFYQRRWTKILLWNRL